METMQEKCDKITGFLLKRETERQSDIKKKKEDKQQFIAENEKIDHFEKSFAEQKLEIEKSINKSSDLEPMHLATHFDVISKNILTLQKYVAACNIFLRGYDIKVCHQSLQELTLKAKELEEKLLPKKKFGFKNKPKPKDPVVTTNGHCKDEVDNATTCSINLNENFCGFENETLKTLTLGKAETFKKDVTVRNMQNCIIKIFGSPSTLHMNYLKNCVVLSGPVSTSIFAENCENCKFIIACQQLRLHGSVNTDIYLHVTSRAIMEDCKRILIAPYNYKYKTIEEDFSNSALDIKTNNWTSIDDFNWLNIEKQSPNWSVLEDANRISDWDQFCLNTG